MAASDNRQIFFVDDEPKVREVIGETLEQLGLKVICFANAADWRSGDVICSSPT